MSKQTEALKLALEALKEIHPGNMTPMAEEAWDKAITAIREALAEQPAQQWVDAGDLNQLKKGDRVRVLYKGVEDVEFTFSSSASYGADDGSFCWGLFFVSGSLYRDIGARIDTETGAVYADSGWKVEVLK